jgi:hypothetical protein
MYDNKNIQEYRRGHKSGINIDRTKAQFWLYNDGQRGTAD